MVEGNPRQWRVCGEGGYVRAQAQLRELVVGAGTSPPFILQFLQILLLHFQTAGCSLACRRA